MARSSEGRRRGPGPIQRLRADFLTGLVVVLPAALTVALVAWAIGFVDDKVLPLLPGWLGEGHVAGIGILVFAAFTTLVGALIKGYAGRRALRAGETLLHRVPVVRPLYVAAKQTVQAAIAKGGTSFRQTCLVEYPQRGMWTLAFIAGPAEGEMAERTGEPDLVAVFLATAPNPITGWFYYVPRRDVVVLDMSFEEGLRLVLSCGIAEPKPATQGLA